MCTAFCHSTTHSGNKTRHQDHSKASFSFNTISTRQSSPAMLKPVHCSSPSFTRLPLGDSTSLRRCQIQPDVVAFCLSGCFSKPQQIVLPQGSRCVIEVWRAPKAPLMGFRPIALVSGGAGFSIPGCDGNPQARREGREHVLSSRPRARNAEITSRGPRHSERGL